MIFTYAKYAKDVKIIGEFSGCPYVRVVDERVKWTGGSRVVSDRVRSFYITGAGKCLHAPKNMITDVTVDGMPDKDKAFVNDYTEQLV